MRTSRIAPLLLLVALLVSLPAGAQDWARQALDKSPRHREWVSLKVGTQTVNTWVVYPEVPNKAPVLVLIHEIFGLSDWAREMADELAAAGYIVVAPDLLSGTGPKGGGTSDFPDTDAVVKAVFALPPAQVTADLDAAADYGKHLPAGNGKLGVIGFCWGGGNTFAYASHRADINAAFVFYGPAPDAAVLPKIQAPIYAFYAGNDARITATVPDTVQAMKAAGKKFEPVIYPGAGHGFMRAGEAPDASPENAQARRTAFARLLGLLKGL